jgi:hypothetical protein
MTGTGERHDLIQRPRPGGPALRIIDQHGELITTVLARRQRRDHQVQGLRNARPPRWRFRRVVAFRHGIRALHPDGQAGDDGCPGKCPLLLGLVAEPHGDGGRIISELGLTYSAVRAALESLPEAESAVQHGEVVVRLRERDEQDHVKPQASLKPKRLRQRIARTPKQSRFPDRLPWTAFTAPSNGPGLSFSRPGVTFAPPPAWPRRLAFKAAGLGEQIAKLDRPVWERATTPAADISCVLSSGDLG